MNPLALFFSILTARFTTIAAILFRPPVLRPSLPCGRVALFRRLPPGAVMPPCRRASRSWWRQARWIWSFPVTGSTTATGARVLSEHPLPVADIASLIAAFRARDWEYTFVSEHHMAAGRSRGSSHRMLQGYPCYTVAPDYYREHAVHQLVVLAPETEEAALLAILADHGGRYRAVRSHASAVDVFHADGQQGARH